MKSKLIHTLKRGRIYEQWSCCWVDCFEHDKVHYRQRDEFPINKPEVKHRMELHGDEYHRTHLVRVFRNDSDISTLFEVVPTLKEAEEEIDRKAEVGLEQAREILRAHKKRSTVPESTTMRR